MSAVSPRSNFGAAARPAVAPRSYLKAAPVQPGRVQQGRVQAVVTRTGTGRRVRLIRAGVIMALLITAVNQFPHFLPGASASNEKVSAGSIHWVSVRAGDSLWSLAQQYAPNTDPREWIDQVTTINNLGTAGIFAGERIALPSN